MGPSDLTIEILEEIRDEVKTVRDEVRVQHDLRPRVERCEHIAALQRILGEG